MIQMILVSILFVSLVVADTLGTKISANLDILLPAPNAIRIDDNIRTNVFNSGNITAKLYVPPGYWKISTKTVNPIKCPISEACLGFSDSTIYLCQCSSALHNLRNPFLKS
jgi:hypothetical protein